MKSRDMAELRLLAAIWGGSFLFLRQASPAIGSLGVAGWRVTEGALVGWVWAREPLSIRRAAGLLLGLLGWPCWLLTRTSSQRLIERIGASRALTVTFLTPAFGMLWGALCLGERITPAMVLGTSVILAGTWLSNQGTSTPGQNPPRDA